MARPRNGSRFFNSVVHLRDRTRLCGPCIAAKAGYRNSPKLFGFVAAVKRLPVHRHSADYIFWSFGIIIEFRLSPY